MFKKKLDLEAQLKKFEKDSADEHGAFYWICIVLFWAAIGVFLFGQLAAIGYGPAALISGILAEHNCDFFIKDAPSYMIDRSRGGSPGTQNFNNAEVWYTLAAQDGSVYATYRLGKLLCDHPSELAGTPDKNAATGLFWLETAAEMGSEDAMLMAGKEHLSGRIGGTDLQKAKMYFSMACKAGSEDGCKLESDMR